MFLTQKMINSLVAVIKMIVNRKGSRKKGEGNARRKNTLEKLSNIVSSEKVRFFLKEWRRCITILG